MATEVKDAATGEIKKAVDFDALREELGDVAEGARERYRFTWPGKREAKEEARRPIAKTMRPVKERSKNWDSTHNLYIEGDNLDALKILRETYAGKIKMIYIDPPYNTGHDFIYQDKFRKDADDYAGESGDYDEEGGRLVANPESNGRFHSNWCSMMYPRLLLAHDLLSSDGGIFISIDDNELVNLTEICNQLYGEANHIGTIVWQHSIQPKGYSGSISMQHSYMVIYAKNVTQFSLGDFERTEDDNKAYSNPDNDPKGPWRSGDVRNSLYRPNLIFDITAPNGNVIHPCANGWRWSKGTIEEKLKSGEILFNRDQTKIIRKIYLNGLSGRAPESLWLGKKFGTTRDGVAELKQLFTQPPFDTPKPTTLLKSCAQLLKDSSMTVLDFFSGSATTAHAVMQLNAEDSGNRRFIMVQLPEVCDEKSEAAKAGYRTICDIGEERIRRAGEKIKAEVEKANEQLELGAEPKQVPDIGFRVLRIDSSNYRDVRKSPNDYSQGMLDSMVDVSEVGRSPLDKLFECFPTFQLPYDSSIEVLDDSAFVNHTVYSVNGGQLVACFDADIPESVLRGMAALEPKPSYAVVAEAGLNNSQTVTNFAEIFKQAANAEQGATQVRVI